MVERAIKRSLRNDPGCIVRFNSTLVTVVMLIRLGSQELPGGFEQAANLNVIKLNKFTWSMALVNDLRIRTHLLRIRQKYNTSISLFRNKRIKNALNKKNQISILARLYAAKRKK